MENHAHLHARLRCALGALHAHHGARPPHRRLPGHQWPAAVRRQSTARLPNRLEGLCPAHPGKLAGHAQLHRTRRRRHHHHPAQHLARQLPHRLHALCDLPAPALGRSFSHPIRIPAHATATARPLHSPGRRYLRSRQHQGHSLQYRHGCRPLRERSGSAHPGRRGQRAQPQRHRSQVQQWHALHLDAGPGAQVGKPDGRCSLRWNGR